ncbi:hypothetical protein [Phaeovulum sp.]|uniref:hypothetical protein n=1 Tax=Phaeovulum sp. TaxID=2934796 RepID=UPI0039E66AE7
MKRISTIATIAVCGALLGGCQTTEPEDMVGESIQPVISDNLLQEREPDLCHAADYASYLTQSADVIPSLGITQPYRIVEWRGIEPQEYSANRLVFRLDQNGNIFNVDCG